MKSKRSAPAKPEPVAGHRYCSLRMITPPTLTPGLSFERASLILKNGNKWVNGTTLHYYFFDKDTDGEDVEDSSGNKTWKSWVGTKRQMDVVKKAFSEWKKVGIGLEFAEVKNREDAEVRVGFMEDDGAWSYVGRDILKQPVNARTMNFGWNIDTPDPHNGLDTPIHEIGHTLGFPHEHQNPYAGIVWDEEAVYASLGAPPNNWPRDQTYYNIIRKLSTKEVSGSRWDPDSIMHYPFEPGLILKPVKYNKSGINPPGGLSKRDIKWVKSFYPTMTAKNFTPVTQMMSYELNANNSEQQNFTFAPSESKSYTIQTFGNLDTVMVLFEEKEDKELQYLAGNDNSGTDKNASIAMKLFRGKKYVVKVRIYYKNPKEKTALMIW